MSLVPDKLVDLCKQLIRDQISKYKPDNKTTKDGVATLPIPEIVKKYVCDHREIKFTIARGVWVGGWRYEDVAKLGGHD